MVLARYFILPYVYGVGSPRFQRAVVDLIPWKKLHELRDMTDVMHNTSLEIFAATKQAMEKGDLAERTTRIGAGKDIMSVLR
jgi:tRNA(Leu) C34 or U34 (ribose-2'-O)-methylase TrmL